MRIPRHLCLIVLVVAYAAPPAQAQWVATPYLGVNLAGDAEFRRGGPGGSVGYVGDRLGFELDLQRYFHFFKDRNVDVVPNNCGVVAHTTPCIDLNTRAWSFMANVVAPIGGKHARWRSYGAAGLGVIHSWIDGPGDQYDIAQDNVAFNIGGGVMHSLTKRIGFRSDLRYFRALVDEDKREGYHEDYGFLRATVGVTVGFPGI